jgi:hypothetical protein
MQYAFLHQKDVEEPCNFKITALSTIFQAHTKVVKHISATVNHLTTDDTHLSTVENLTYNCRTSRYTLQTHQYS